MCAKTTGTILGKGIYAADTFTKSLKYCEGIKQGASEHCFMLLCQVALGNSQDVGNSKINSSEPFDFTKYQSRQAHGRQIPDPRHTITRSYGTFSFQISIEFPMKHIHMHSRCSYANR